MTDTLTHRGPDDYEVWTDAPNGVALGHTRLSIVDLSETGRQPMTSKCGRFVLTYNGEVYNFTELRRELEGIGHEFRGRSDTEVLLTAIIEWGVEETLRRANGMLAFGLWDRRTRTLTLARDRVGKKPLYYGWYGDAFFFGSELKALRAHSDFHAEIDRTALGLFLRYSWIPAPLSIFKNVYKLRPGSLLIIGQNGTFDNARSHSYWSAREIAERTHHSPFLGTFEEASDALDGLLRDAVRRRMVADVEVGALLSGGIDSTTVVSLMQAESSRPAKTFTIGFSEPQFNEAGYAREIAHHLGTDHRELYVTPGDALAVIPNLPSIYDEPFADPSQIPTYLICKLAHEDVKVTLSGDGGDELFVGYKRYTKAVNSWRRSRHVPFWLRQSSARAMEAMGRASWLVLGSSESNAETELASWRRFGSHLEKLSKWLPADSAEEVSERKRARCSPEEFIQGVDDWPSTMSGNQASASISEPIQSMLCEDFCGYMTDDILVKVDRASMAVSLEVRCPLLDHRVVEFAWSLPMSMRLQHGHGKRILRSVLERYVPPALTERPKRGFSVPVSSWIRGPLRDWAEDLLEDGRIREQGLLNPKSVRRIWQQHLTGWRNHQILLWSLLMFQAWYDMAYQPASLAESMKVAHR